MTLHFGQKQDHFSKTK